MPSPAVLFALLMPLVFSACAVTPSSDADFAPDAEEPEGAGVFSGDSGEIVFFADSDQPGQTAELKADDWREFEAFKQWLASRRSNDADYREFRLWLDYRQFKAETDPAAE